MSLDIDALLAELTLAEKASLTSGSSFWYTAPVARLGIPRIMVSVAVVVVKRPSSPTKVPSTSASSNPTAAVR